MAIPKDPIILLSYINLKLRDYYDSLDELCESMGVDKTELVNKLASIDYKYDKIANQFR